MGSSRLVRKRHSHSNQVVGEFARETLRNLLPLTVVMAWGGAVLVIFFAEPHTAHAYLVLGLLVATTWASYRLSEKRLGLAVGLYVSGLTGATIIIAFAFDNPAVLYLCVQIVLITAMLTNPRIMWGVALANVAIILNIGIRGQLAEWSELVLPATFTLLTAATCQVSSQRVFNALNWALGMMDEARMNAEAAREHRAEVVRLLKGLDEAYVRLERVNEELLLARETANKAYRFKAEFVANVSHELRTPLNLIDGFSEMIVTAPETYGGVELPKEYRGDVMAIYRSARHLSELIDDVLDLSRIEASSMPLVKEETDLAEIAREAIELVRGLAEARGLWVELDVQDCVPNLNLDRTRIRQVLLNLLTNAARFTDEGGIQVRIRIDDHKAVVAVEDSGRGISADRIEGAFRAFSQLEDGEAREGSGLGLAVSQRFVELHGGSMWIESEVGRGTTVGFSLPVPRAGKEVPVSRLTTSAAPQPRAGDPPVLILHDDPRALSLVQRHVHGYQFTLAETVGEAREYIQRIMPATVVMSTTWNSREGTSPADMGLPLHTSLLACPLPSMRRIGLLLGAADYLVKPVTREQLREALSRLPAPPQKVLIVDDNPHVVRLLARMLKAISSPSRVLKAFGAREALELARSERPDVMLLDLLMPEMDGYDVLEKMSQEDIAAETRVIIISAHGLEQEAPPLFGEIRVERGTGFSITEVLQLLRATLGVTTLASAMAPGSDVVTPATEPA